MLDVVASSLAVAALGGWTIAQATTPDDGVAARTSLASITDAPRARETTLGFYGGIPNTLPSDVVINKTNVHDFMVKDVQWEGKPFVNPIYYGVRTTRWLTARSGTMLDFTHSKAIALRDIPHAMEGTLKGQPAPLPAPSMSTSASSKPATATTC